MGVGSRLKTCVVTIAFYTGDLMHLSALLGS